MKLYGIIGHPIGHTLSPAMQQAAFDVLRMRACYVPFDVPPARLRRAVGLLRALHVDGFNVTVPHKERIARHLDALDPSARALGAVNTVVRRGRRLIGYNTDAPGLLAAWRKAHHLRLRGCTALLLGAGGAARAVLWALAHAGVAHVTVTNRSPRRAVRLQRWSRRTLPQLSVTRVPWSQREAWVTTHRADLLVNATALGLHAGDPLPMTLAHVPRAGIVYDVAYRQPTTAWVAAARRRGLLAFDGRSMLLYQGTQAFARWTKRPAPVDVMARALARALSRR